MIAERASDLRFSGALSSSPTGSVSGSLSFFLVDFLVLPFASLPLVDDLAAFWPFFAAFAVDLADAQPLH